MKMFCPTCVNSIPVRKSNQDKVFNCPLCECSLYLSKISNTDFKLIGFEINSSSEIESLLDEIEEYAEDID